MKNDVTNFYCDYVINGEKDKWTRLLVFEGHESFESMKNEMLQSLNDDFANNFKVLEYRLREETLLQREVTLKNKIINSFFADLGTKDILELSQKFSQKINSEYAIYFIDKEFYLSHESDIPYKARFYRFDKFDNYYFGITARDLFYESTVAEYIIEHNDDFGFPELREILDKYNK